MDTVKSYKQVPSLNIPHVTLVGNGFMKLLGGQAGAATGYAQSSGTTAVSLGGELKVLSNADGLLL